MAIRLPDIIQTILVDTRKSLPDVDRLNKSVANLGKSVEDTGRKSDAASADVDKFGRSARDAGGGADESGRRIGFLGRAMSTLRGELRGTNSDFGAFRLHLRGSGEDADDSDGKVSRLRLTFAKLGNGVQGLSGVFKSARSRLGDFQAGASGVDSGLKALTGALGAAGGASNFFNAALGLLKVPAIIAAINTAIGAVSALGSAFVGLAGAVGPAVGALAAVPAALVGIGQVMATVKLGLKGVLGAVKLAGKSTGGGGGGGGGRSAAEELLAIDQATQGVVRANYQLAQSQKTLTTAQQNLDDVRKSGQSQRDLASAERAVASAYDGTKSAVNALKTAEERLQDARDNAASGRSIEEVQITVERASLRAARAQDNLAEAQRALNDAQLRNDPKLITEAQRNLTEAQIEVKEASWDVADAQKALGRAQGENGTIARDLVDAQLAVSSAQRSLGQSTDDVADAQENLTKVQRDYASNKALLDATDAYQQAQMGVTDALLGVRQAEQALASARKGSGGGGGGAIDQYAEALAKLGPAQRQLVQDIVDFQKKVETLGNAIGEAFAPGASALVRSFGGVLDSVKGELVDTASALGDVAKQTADWLGSDLFKSQLKSTMQANVGVVRAFAEAGLRLAQSLFKLLGPGQKILNWAARLATRFSVYVERATDAGVATGKLDRFMDRSIATLERLGRIVKNVGTILFNVFKAATPLGESLFDQIDRGSKSLADLTGSVKGQNALMKFFWDAKPAIDAVSRLVADIARGFAGLSKQTGLAELIDQIRTELLPVILGVSDNVSRGFGPRVIGAITEFAKAWAALAGESGPLNIFLDVMTGLGKALNFLLNDLGPVSDGLRQIIFVLGVLKATSAALNLAKFVTGWNALSTSLLGAEGSLARFSAGAGFAEGAAGGLAGNLGKVVGWLTGAGGTAGLLRSLGLVAGALAGAAALFYGTRKAISLWNDQLRDMQKALKATDAEPVNNAALAMIKLRDGADKTSSALKNYTQEAFIAASGGKSMHDALAANPLNETLQKQIPAAIKLIDDFSHRNGIGRDSVVKLANALSIDLGNASKDEQATLGHAIDAVNNLHKATGVSKERVLELADALGINLARATKAQREELADAVAQAGRATTATETLAQANEVLTHSTSTVAEQYDAMKVALDATIGTMESGARTALHQQEQVDRLGEAYAETHGNLAELNKQVQSGVLDTSRLTREQRNLYGEFLNSVDGIRAEVDELVKSGKISGDAAAQKKELIDRLNVLGDKYKGMKPVIDTYIGSLGDIKTADAPSEAQAMIDRLSELKNTYPQLKGPIDELVGKLKTVDGNLANATVGQVIQKLRDLRGEFPTLRGPIDELIGKLQEVGQQKPTPKVSVTTDDRSFWDVSGRIADLTKPRELSITAKIKGIADKVWNLLTGGESGGKFSITPPIRLAAGGMAGLGSKTWQGGVTRGPQVLVGEGRPQYPEFVIPTDPQYRDRAERLQAMLASVIGTNGLEGAVREYASGGVVQAGLRRGAEGSRDLEAVLAAAIRRIQASEADAQQRMLAAQERIAETIATLRERGMGAYGVAPTVVPAAAMAAMQFAKGRADLDEARQTVYGDTHISVLAQTNADSQEIARDIAWEQRIRRR